MPKTTEKPLDFGNTAMADRITKSHFFEKEKKKKAAEKKKKQLTV